MGRGVIVNKRVNNTILYSKMYESGIAVFAKHIWKLPGIYTVSV